MCFVHIYTYQNFINHEKLARLSVFSCTKQRRKIQKYFICSKAHDLFKLVSEDTEIAPKGKVDYETSGSTNVFLVYTLLSTDVGNIRTKANCG